jgi:hypothetical protein
MRSAFSAISTARRADTQRPSLFTKARAASSKRRSAHGEVAQSLNRLASAGDSATTGAEALSGLDEIKADHKIGRAEA